MKFRSREILLSTAIATVTPISVSALTLTTVAIDNYTANGGGHDLTTRVAEANGIANALSSRGWTWQYANYNSSAQYWLFTTPTGGITISDMMFYSGHGTYQGPFLGYSSGYTPNNSTYDCRNYKWSQNNLKWAIFSGCQFLWDGVTSNSAANWTFNPTTSPRGLGRLYNAFSNNGTIPNGTLHIILGNRSEGWDLSTNYSFVSRALDGSGMSVGQAWFDYEYWEMYWGFKSVGIEPAAMSAVQGSADWFNENLKTPWLNPGQCGGVAYSYRYNWIGSPQFDTAQWGAF
jgi:hypothetical protein